MLCRLSLVIRLERAEGCIKTIKSRRHIRTAAARQRGIARHIQRICMPNPNGSIRNRCNEIRIDAQMGCNVRNPVAAAQQSFDRRDVGQTKVMHNGPAAQDSAMGTRASPRCSSE